MACCEGVHGIELVDLSRFREGLVVAPDSQKEVRVRMVGPLVTWVQLDSSPELAFGAGEVPVFLEKHACECGVRLAQVRIELQRFQRRRSTQPMRIFRIDPRSVPGGASRGHGGVGQGIVRIAVDRLLEIFDRYARGVLGPLEKRLPAKRVQPVGFEVRRIAPDERHRGRLWSNLSESSAGISR